MLGAQEVVSGISAEDSGVGGGEGGVKDKLDCGGRCAVVFTRDNASIEGGWSAIRMNDGLPATGVIVNEIILILPHV